MMLHLLSHRTHLCWALVLIFCSIAAAREPSEETIEYTPDLAVSQGKLCYTVYDWEKKKEVVILGDEEVCEYDEVKHLGVYNGKLCIVAVKNGRERVIYGDKVIDEFDIVGVPFQTHLSPDEKHFLEYCGGIAFVAGKPDPDFPSFYDKYIWANGEVYGPYVTVAGLNICEGKICAIVTYPIRGDRREHVTVFIDGEETGKLKVTYEDGKHIPDQVFLIDGKLGYTVTVWRDYHMTFKTSDYYVINGKKSKELSGRIRVIGTPFGACVYSRGSYGFVLLNGVEISEKEDMIITAAVIGEDIIIAGFDRSENEHVLWYKGKRYPVTGRVWDEFITDSQKERFCFITSDPGGLFSIWVDTEKRITRKGYASDCIPNFADGKLAYAYCYSPKRNLEVYVEGFDIVRLKSAYVIGNVFLVDSEITFAYVDFSESKHYYYVGGKTIPFTRNESGEHEDKPGKDIGE